MTTKQFNALDRFTRAYLVAACFTSDPRPGQGEYSESRAADILALVPESETEKTLGDCAKFQTDNASLFDGDEEHAGRDFWYTRNGHGCGFWDGDWPEDTGDKLTARAENYGEDDWLCLAIKDAANELDGVPEESE